MTTETPFSVADLRRWAENNRTLAEWWDASALPEVADDRRAQAAAFDALADAREACAVRCESTDSLELSDAFVRGNNEARREIGRILSGVKP